MFLSVTRIDGYIVAITTHLQLLLHPGELYKGDQILGPTTYQSLPKSYIAGPRQVLEATPPLSRSNHRDESQRKAEKKMFGLYRGLNWGHSDSEADDIPMCRRASQHHSALT